MMDADARLRGDRAEHQDVTEAFTEAWARTLRGPETRILTFGPVTLVDFGEPIFGREREFVTSADAPDTVVGEVEEADAGPHWLSVFTQSPERTLAAYRALGYRLLRRETLMRRSVAAPLPSARDVDVRTVTTWEEAERVDAAFGWTSIREEHLEDPFLHHYYATADGTTIARATLGLTAEGVCVIDAVRTAPGHRGLGYATALVTRALEDAHAAGATTCLLSASEEGVSLYRRLGFEDAGLLLVMEPHEAV